MPIVLHILQKTEGEILVSKIIDLSSVSSVNTEYKKEVEGSSVDMELVHANSQNTMIEINDSGKTIFTFIDNLGNEIEKTSDVVKAEQTIMSSLAAEVFGVSQ